MEFSHISVMAPEVMEALKPERGGVFVDCTAGGGGHSLEIAKRLPEGSRLICLDRDDEALEACKKRLADYADKVTLVKSNFLNLASALDSLGIGRIDGAMWDLGVSSHQLDEGERGFSYSKDAPRRGCSGSAEGSFRYLRPRCSALPRDPRPSSLRFCRTAERREMHRICIRRIP